MTYRDIHHLLEAPSTPAAAEARGGPSLVILGAAPGAGAATVAANLCFLLAGAGQSVEALDLRDYPRLAMLLQAHRPPGGGRRTRVSSSARCPTSP
jgi:Mrp family chromosome partitioning ATPase